MDEDMGLSIGAGIAQGFEKGTTNFINAFQAVRSMKDQARKNDLSMKQAKLEIQKLENELDPEVLEQNKTLLNARIKAQKSMDQYNIARANRELQVIKQNQVLNADRTNRYSMANKILKEAMLDPEASQRIGVSVSGIPYLSPAKTATSALDKILNEGGTTVPKVGSAQPKAQKPPAQSVSKIRVKRKSDGQIGEMSESSFNINQELYERV